MRRIKTQLLHLVGLISLCNKFPVTYGIKSSNSAFTKTPRIIRLLYTSFHFSEPTYSYLAISSVENTQIHKARNIKVIYIYRVIHKPLQDFRPLRYSSRDGHAEGEHVNRGRDTSSFCPTLQVLDMSTLGDAAEINLATHAARVWQELDYRIDICRVTKSEHIEHL